MSGLVVFVPGMGGHNHNPLLRLCDLFNIFSAFTLLTYCRVSLLLVSHNTKHTQLMRYGLLGISTMK
jgi:hypothetical protein